MTLTCDNVKSLFLSPGNCLSQTQLDGCYSDTRWMNYGVDCDAICEHAYYENVPAMYFILHFFFLLLFCCRNLVSTSFKSCLVLILFSSLCLSRSHFDVLSFSLVVLYRVTVSSRRHGITSRHITSRHVSSRLVLSRLVLFSCSCSCCAWYARQSSCCLVSPVFVLVLVVSACLILDLSPQSARLVVFVVFTFTDRKLVMNLS